MNFKEIVAETFINEEVGAPKGKGIIVFDIDDTIVRAKNLRIRTESGKALTPTEFANLPAEEKEKGKFDFSDFRNFNKLFDSIITGTPITKNLKMLDIHYNKGWDIGFLTARGVEKANSDAIKQWLKVRNKINGSLEPINPAKIKFFVAVNDPKRVKETEKAGVKGTAEAKKYFLKQLTNKYDEVKFVDDDDNFIKAAREVLPVKNVIKAQGL